MRILLVNHTFGANNGQGRVNAEIAAHLLRSGHEPTLVSGDATVDPQLSEATHHSIPGGGAPTQLLRDRAFGSRTAEAIHRLRDRHDLVVGNGGMTYEPTDVNLCHFVHASWRKRPQHPLRSARGARRLWGLYQYAYTRQAERWERDAYHRARRVVAVSDLVRDQLVDDVDVDRAKVSVIENGLDPLPADELASARENARRVFDVPDDAFVVFFAAELRTTRKNLDVLLEALPLLPENVVLVAAGDHRGGPYEERVRRSGLGRRVRLLGFRKDVRGLYTGGDVFALASHYDPCPVTIGEAMAAGLPVVTARSVGSASLVARSHAGVVVDDPTDEAAVAGAVRGLMNDPALRRQTGDNGRAAAAELAWSRVGERYVRVFEEVIAERGQAAPATAGGGR